MLIVSIMAIMPSTAHAYIDPGTGSYLVQILIAVFAGGAFVLRTFWMNIKALFSRKSKETKTDGVEKDTTSDEGKKVS